MEYNHILIRYGELSLKGKNRHKFVSQLKANLKIKLWEYPNLKIIKERDRMFIELHGEDHLGVINILKDIFGIYSFSLAMKTSNNIEDIQKCALAALNETASTPKTFKVTGKRIDKSYPIDSMELNQVVGGYLLKHTTDLTVDVHNPDVDVRVEVRQGETYVTCQNIKGKGGFPVGSNGKVLLMLSGGIDSPVAGYLSMKRGVTVEAIHFHSPPFTSERAKQKVVDLAQKLTRFGNRVKVHVVPFTEIQKAIQKEIPDGYSMTSTRRMMLRIAERVAKERRALAIATGESLGQVASQTLDSMYAINAVTNYPIIRPLIAMDKIEIMEIARNIDTYDISIRPFEDCCTVFLPASPKTKPKLESIDYYESKFDFEPLLQKAIDTIEVVSLSGRQKEKQAEHEDLF